MHSIPSLNHQSSTQSDLAQSNVNYDDFNIEYDAAPETSAEQHLDNESAAIQANITEKCSFQRNTIQLPPDIAFQVQLMSQLDYHRGNDLNIFSEITSCIKRHAVHHNVDFTSLQMLSRKQLVDMLTKHYRLHFLKPTLRTINLSNGTLATMTVFDVKALLLAFLNDPLKMKEQNSASNYNIFTGKAKTRTSVVDEIHTGLLWEPARQKYCGDNPDAFPCALACFYDKTNVDVDRKSTR